MGITSSLLRLPEKTIGKAVIAGVERAVEHRWEDAVERAAQTAGLTTEARIDALRSSFTKELAAVGAASGGLAALPGAGTATALATVAADIGWYTTRVADLIMTMAVVHGHDRASVDERRTWVLAVLAFGDSASLGLTKVAGEIGKNVGTRSVAGIPAPMLRSINRRLGAKLLTKYGSREGALQLGKLLPFGFGAAIGAGGNTYGVRAVVRHADRFFRELPATPIEAVGRES